ncbi:Hypothetical predicted protein [Scomber scombrus]|uniref:Secreted protein n=1 Tax=Scomber scombrus TaxID=13677 RepID=A0AAV1P0D2_SCOSC
MLTLMLALGVVNSVRVTTVHFCPSILLHSDMQDSIRKCIIHFIRSKPISCILFVPGPTSSTWKHPILCRYTTVAHNVQASAFCSCETSAALFCRSVTAPPRVFLEWHHTVTALFSFHPPARHNAYVMLKLFVDFSTLPLYEQGAA